MAVYTVQIYADFCAGFSVLFPNRIVNADSAVKTGPPSSPSIAGAPAPSAASATQYRPLRAPAVGARLVSWPHRDRTDLELVLSTHFFE